MKRKLIIAVALIVFCLIVILPPLIHGYIYPNIGDDSAAHMNILDKVGFFATDGGNPMQEIRYTGLYIVGYPLDLVSHIFNISKDTLFLWFNYLALIGVGITLFLIFKNLLGLTAGLLALLIPAFASFSILLLFYSGVIFNIINMGIIFPFACLFTIKWLGTRKKRFFVGAILAFILFAIFHTTGIYLPFIIIAGFTSYIIYKLTKRETINKKTIVVTSAVGIVGIVLFMVFSPMAKSLLFESSIHRDSISGFELLSESLTHYLSIFVLAVIIISITWLIGKYKKITNVEKLIVLVFGLSAVVMLPAMLFGWSLIPFRQGYDFAILLSIVAVALISILIRLDKKRLVSFLLVGLVIGGSVINLIGWFGYNSAIEKVDIEAINYINSLQYDYYSCSDNVDHWIYDRYIDKDYLAIGGDVLVVRNIPMKSKVASDIELNSIYNRVLLKYFSDGDITIRVYR